MHSYFSYLKWGMKSKIWWMQFATGLFLPFLTTLMDILINVKVYSKKLSHSTFCHVYYWRMWVKWMDSMLRRSPNFRQMSPRDLHKPMEIKPTTDPFTRWIVMALLGLFTVRLMPTYRLYMHQNKLLWVAACRQIRHWCVHFNKDDIK